MPEEQSQQEQQLPQKSHFTEKQAIPIRDLTRHEGKLVEKYLREGSSKVFSKLFNIGAPVVHYLAENKANGYGVDDLISTIATEENLDDLHSWINPGSFYKVADGLKRLGTVDTIRTLDPLLQNGMLFDSYDKKDAFHVITAIEQRTHDSQDLAYLHGVKEKWMNSLGSKWNEWDEDFDDFVRRAYKSTHPSVIAFEHVLEIERMKENSERPKSKSISDKRQNRGEIVRNIIDMPGSTMLGKRGKDVPSHAIELMQEREALPSEYAVTMGIEIEVGRFALDPGTQESKSWTMSQWEQYAKEQFEKYQKTPEQGIPAGGDAYWEFAHRPVGHYLTLAREVQALQRLNLVKAENSRHALHLTLGGVSSEGPGGEEAYVLARSLEATGWASSHRRLRASLPGSETAADVKGIGGIKERPKDEMEGGGKGIEMRIFQMLGIGGLDRTLRSGYALGSALKAYQEELLGEQQDDLIKTELADIWRTFSDRSKQVFHKYGLGNAAAVKWGGSPPDDRLEDDHEDPLDGQDESGKEFFLSMAELMQEAEKDPQSRGATFQREIKDIISTSSASAIKVLNKDSKVKV